jgi:hypothetical protein
VLSVGTFGGCFRWVLSAAVAVAVAAVDAVDVGGVGAVGAVDAAGPERGSWWDFSALLSEGNSR